MKEISQINLQSIQNMAKIIDRYFHLFEIKYLKDSNKFLGIVESYIKVVVKKTQYIANTVDNRDISVNFSLII